MARRKRASGYGLALEQIPEPGRPTARCCRSCISTATRSPIRRILARITREELEQLFRGYGWTPLLCGGPRARVDASRRWRPRWTGHRADPDRSSKRRASWATYDRPRWPMIVLESPKGLDRTQSGRRPADRRNLPLPPGAALRPADDPEHLKLLEEWLKSYRPEELFDEQGGSIANWPNSRPRANGAWAPIHMPMAACCCAIFACRTSAIMRSRFPRPGSRGVGDTHRARATFCATS